MHRIHPVVRWLGFWTLVLAATGYAFSLFGKSDGESQKGSSRGSDKSTSTFLDSLNEGREIVLQADDFLRPGQGEPTSEQDSGASSAAGFYVQFFATVQKDYAEKEKERIQSDLNVTVFMTYEDPYYKLRAGRFETREQAEAFKQQMTESGHRTVWIVRSK